MSLIDQAEQARLMGNANAAVNPFLVASNKSIGVSNGTITAARQANLWPETTEFVIQVSAASNGFVVKIARGQGHIAKTWIVTQEDDLVKVIAAAIVDLKLELTK